MLINNYKSSMFDTSEGCEWTEIAVTIALTGSNYCSCMYADPTV